MIKFARSVFDIRFEIRRDVRISFDIFHDDGILIRTVVTRANGNNDKMKTCSILPHARDFHEQLTRPKRR